MDLEALRAVLDQLGVRPDAYSSAAGLLNDRYAIELRGGNWYVYYSERGQVTWERLCATEDEARSLFIATLKNDPTTRRR
jgi:hypothetical protein